MNKKIRKARLRKIKKNFYEIYNFVLRKTEEKDLQERIEYLRYEIFFNNQLATLLSRATEDELRDFEDNLIIAQKIISGSYFNQIEHLIAYLNGLSKSSEIFSIETIKEKETICCIKTKNKNNLGMSEHRFAYLRQHLILHFSSGEKIPILPFGKIQKEAL